MSVSLLVNGEEEHFAQPASLFWIWLKEMIHVKSHLENYSELSNERTITVCLLTSKKWIALKNNTSSGDLCQPLVLPILWVLYHYFHSAKFYLPSHPAWEAWQGEGENWIPSLLPTRSRKDLKELMHEDGSATTGRKTYCM